MNGRSIIPPRPQKQSDSVMTPSGYAQATCKYLLPQGRICEPCAGDGAFVEVLMLCTLQNVDWFENDPARDYFRANTGDFLTYEQIDDLPRFDWIVTNPPWSKITPFLQRSFLCADNVAFLMPIPRAFFNAPLNAAREACFGIKRILEMPWPSVWTREYKIVKPGFAIGVVHWQKNWFGPMIHDILLESEVTRCD